MILDVTFISLRPQTQDVITDSKAF